MKRFLNKFAPLAKFSALLTAGALLFASCSGLVGGIEERDENKGGTGYVKVSFGEEDARTIFAGAGDAEDFVKITLTGTGPSSTSLESYTWETYENISKDAHVFECAAGSWTFTLTAYRYVIESDTAGTSTETDTSTDANGSTPEEVTVDGVQFSQTLTATVASGESKTLQFTDMKPVADCVDRGALDFTLTGDGSFSDIKLTLTDPAATDGAQTLIDGASFTKKDDGSWTYFNSTVPSGNYLLTATIYNGSDIKFTYATWIMVEAGYPTKAQFSLANDSLTLIQALDSRSCEVTYNANYPASTSETTDETTTAPADVKQIYYTGSQILGLGSDMVNFDVPEGYRFRYWSVDQAGAEGSDRYYPGDTPNLVSSSSLTLYAIWTSGTSVVINYNINLEGQTGTKEQTGTYAAYNTLLDLTGSGFTTPQGKTFIGWNTAADGSGTSYNAGTSQYITGDMELYAQWCDYDTSTSTYLIDTNEEWNAVFNSYTNRSTISTKVKLMGNLTTPDVSFTKNKYLSAEFDGNGKTISGLTGNLFYNIKSSGSVKNLTVECDENAAFTNAVIAYDNYGTIDSVTVSGTAAISGSRPAGIAGDNDGTISNCTVDATITVSSPTYAGGIAAYNYSGTIENCSFEGTIAGSSPSYLGGITGCNSSSSKVTGCTVSGTVDADTAFDLGGIVGRNYGTVESSDFYGTLASVTSVTNMGGLVGYNYSSSATVSDCEAGRYYGNYAYKYAVFSAEGTVTNMAAGVAKNEGTVMACTVYSTVTGSPAKYIGGVTAQNSGKVSSCKLTGSLSGSGTYIGGIAAYNTGTLGIIDSTSTSETESTVNLTALSSTATDENADVYYGYVIGKNDGGTVSLDIVCSQQITALSETSYSISNGYTKSFGTLNLKRTAKVTFTLVSTDGLPSVYGALVTSEPGTSTSLEASTSAVEVTGGIRTTGSTETSVTRYWTGKIKHGSTSKAIVEAYLPKGTYYLAVDSDNSWGTAVGTVELILD